MIDVKFKLISSNAQIEKGILKACEEEVKKIVADAVAEVGATSPQQMGQVMKIVQPKVAGKADGGFVSGLVKAALSGN